MQFNYGYNNNTGGIVYYLNNPSNSGPPAPSQYISGGFFGGDAMSAYNANQYPSNYSNYQGHGFNPAYAPHPSGIQVVQNTQQAPPPLPMPMSRMISHHAQDVSAMGQQKFQMDFYKKQGLISDSDDDDVSGLSEKKMKKIRKKQAKLDKKSKELSKKLGEDSEEEQGDEEEIEDPSAQFEEMKLKAEKIAAKVENNADIKEAMRQSFIDEMMRRQTVSGTFDITEGTVKPLGKYAADDPVNVWSKKANGSDLTGTEWNPEFDCECLREAMKGLGTNEAAIIHIVATRCNSQRQKLKEMFKTMYGRDLIEDLRSELSGDFRETIMACFVNPARYDAWSIKEAIYGLGTDEDALIEILMTRTNEQIKEMREEYPDVASPKRKAQRTKIEKDITDDTSGDFKRLLISAVQGNRYTVTREALEQAVEELQMDGKATGIFQVNYEKLVDMVKVKRDAEKLYKAGEKKWGTDEETFNVIFSTRDYYSLRAIWDEYVKLSQRDILNSIDRETSGDFKSGLKGIAMNIKNRPLYLAQKLVKAMKGLGTDDKTLIRIIISRSEIDLVQIKRSFLELTNQTLWRWLKDDTSGDYKKILHAIVGQH